MAKFDWHRSLAAVAVSAWLVAPVSAQPPSRQTPAGASSHGYSRSSDARRSTLDRSSSATPELVRLPPVGPAPVRHLPVVAHHPNSPGVPSVLPNAGAGSEIDGTWREDGQYLILTLNGQQIRLAKETSPRAGATVSQNAPAAAPLADGGEVHGRLLHRGQPLVGCEVAIVPLGKSWFGYQYDRSAKPVRATTDSQGTYCFVQVPAGPYKLKWRPAGEASWIRRAEIRPDVLVRAGKASHVKEIRVALRTIN